MARGPSLETIHSGSVFKPWSTKQGCYTLTSSQPFPASCNLISTFTPIGFLAAEGFPLGSSEAYSVRLVKFPAFPYSPNLVHWKDNEGNPRQLLLNLLIPHRKVFPRGKESPCHTFPMQSLHLHLGNWKPFSLLGYWPMPQGMDNNGRVWKCRMAQSSVDIH